uniref:Uncharacterized protein AlNc14C161G7779 n=1 Tax=Albugo laibachii Nc14 TaxID=890382 RepID=F0WMU3_9STRA|nr:hypothetical protein PITG_02691 [Albugo laibachii Nc14]|eukprot:CCA22628.1 hypothetical protein PITG_02691 [Albugo laibachii Nc14]
MKSPVDNCNSGDRSDDDIELDYDEPCAMDDVEIEDLRVFGESLPIAGKMESGSGHEQCEDTVDIRENKNKIPIKRVETVHLFERSSKEEIRGDIKRTKSAKRDLNPVLLTLQPPKLTESETVQFKAVRQTQEPWFGKYNEGFVQYKPYNEASASEPLPDIPSENEVALIPCAAAARQHVIPAKCNKGNDGTRRAVSTGILLMMKLPKSKQSGNVRKKGAKGKQRLGINAEPSPVLQVNCPVSLNDLIYWMVNCSNVELVGNISDKYPVHFATTKFNLKALTAATTFDNQDAPSDEPYHFVVLYNLNAQMKRAVVQARESASLSSEEAAISIDIEDCTNNKSFFVNLVTQYRLFTVAFINEVTKFYQLKAILWKHMDDVRWFRRDWTVYSTNDRILLFRTLDPSPASMAREVERMYLSSRLNRKFLSGAMHPLGTTNPHVTSTSFDEVIGKLARYSFLSNIAMTFTLQKVCLGLHTCFVFDPLRMSGRNSYLPAQHYNHVELIIFPINVENLHWVIAIARLHTTDGRGRVALYDPMVILEYQGTLVVIWESFCKPFLRSWHERDIPGIASYEDIVVEMLSTPKQRDGHNCGVL